MRLLKDHLFDGALDVLRAEEMIDHDQAFPVGEAVEQYLIMVQPATPSGDELGPIGEDEQYSCAGDAFEEILEDVFRGPVDPMEILDGDDERTHL